MVRRRTEPELDGEIHVPQVDYDNEIDFLRRTQNSYGSKMPAPVAARTG
jgi:hypothetical protein